MIIKKTFCLLGLLLAAGLCVAWEDGAGEMPCLARNLTAARARKLCLLPTPKSMAFAGAPVPVSGPGARALAVVVDRHADWGQIAAAEIVTRMKELAPDVEVQIAFQRVDGAYNIVIQSAFPTVLDADAKIPTTAMSTDQAYVLLPSDAGITLAGNGVPGALYAAVTARRLFGYDGGRVLFHPARIVDWPDVIRREAGEFAGQYHMEHFNTGNFTRHAACMKSMMDFLFRAKINAVRGHSLYLPLPFSPYDDLPYTDAQYAALREINDYAAARGIRPSIITTAALGAHPRDQDRPEVREMFHYAVHREYWSWTRHDLHRAKARRLAEFCARSGTRVVMIHSVDGGGYFNPAHWSERGAACRSAYADDQRARADADVMNIYAETLAAQGVAAVAILYPYTPNCLLADNITEAAGMQGVADYQPEAARIAGAYRSYYHDVNEYLNPAMAICMREAPAASFKLLHDLIPGRPCWVYFLVGQSTRDLPALVLPQTRSIISAHPAPEYEISLYTAARQYEEQNIPVGAEYMWNTGFPGAADYAEGKAPEDYDPAALDIMAERAATGLWGAPAGAVLKDVFNRHLSFQVAVDPQAAIRRLPVKNFDFLIRNNHQAVVQAARALDQAWRELLAARALGAPYIDDFALPWFVQYYRMCKAAVAYSAVNFACHEAYHAFVAGDMPAGGAALARAARELDAGRAAYLETMAATRDEPALITWDRLSKWYKSHLESRLLQPDFEALSAKIRQLDADQDAIHAQYNIPEWFAEYARHTPPWQAARAAAPIVLDGALAAPAWRAAPLVEYFIAWERMGILPYPIHAGLLYDDEYLVLGFSVAQPLIEGIVELKRAMDQRADTEQIEWFIQPAGVHSSCVWQMVLDTGGNLYTQKHLADGSREVGVDFGAQYAVRRDPAGWSCELKIPLRALGGMPHDGAWKTLLAYNRLTSLSPRATALYASTACDKKTFISVLRTPGQAELAFSASDPPDSGRAPAIRLADPKTEDRTHPAGAGTFVEFDLRVEFFRPAYDLTVTAVYLDGAGAAQARQTLFQGDYVPLVWRTARPAAMQLENVHANVQVEIIVEYRTADGAPRQTAKRFTVKQSPADDQSVRFEDGPVPGVQSFAGYGFFYPGTAFHAGHGTVAFWTRPASDGPAAGPVYAAKAPRYFFHYGPLRREHPELINHNAHALYRTHDGRLVFSISNADYDHRQTATPPLDWSTNQWRYIACTWDFTGATSMMRIFVDGQSAGGPVTGKKTPAEQPLAWKTAAPMMMQVGSLNSGRHPARAAISELVISTNIMHHAGFVPMLPTGAAAAPAAAGNLVFSFNGNTDGMRWDDKNNRQEQVKFTPGCPP